MVFTSVDLPAPLSPTRASTSPARTSRSMFFNAWTAPKRLEMPRRDSTVVASTGWVGVGVTVMCRSVSCDLLQAGSGAGGLEGGRADVRHLVDAVLDDGVLDVGLGDRDRAEDRRRHAVGLGGGRGLLSVGQRDGALGGRLGLRLDLLVDGHRLVAGDDPLDRGELGVLTGDRRQRLDAATLQGGDG